MLRTASLGGLSSISYGLPSDMVAAHFGLFGFPGKYLEWDFGAHHTAVLERIQEAQLQKSSLGAYNSQQHLAPMIQYHIVYVLIMLLHLTKAGHIPWGSK